MKSFTQDAINVYFEKIILTCIRIMVFRGHRTCRYMNLGGCCNLGQMTVGGFRGNSETEIDSIILRRENQSVSWIGY